jgi:hypothetical protein
MADWRAVPGVPGYEVSAEGQVRELGKVVMVNGRPVGKPARIVAVTPTEGGYEKVSLSGRPWLLHVLVALVWIGPPPAGMVVDHINGIRSDNRAANLRYLTQKRNVQVGKASKLDEQRAARIRAKYGTKTQAEIAAEEGVSQQQVSKVQRGKAW